jgi:hypothetical protein
MNIRFLRRIFIAIDVSQILHQNIYGVKLWQAGSLFSKNVEEHNWWLFLLSFNGVILIGKCQLLISLCKHLPCLSSLLRLPKSRAITFFDISSKDYNVISFPPMRTRFSHYEVGGYMQRWVRPWNLGFCIFIPFHWTISTLIWGLPLENLSLWMLEERTSMRYSCLFVWNHAVNLLSLIKYGSNVLGSVLKLQLLELYTFGEIFPYTIGMSQHFLIALANRIIWGWSLDMKIGLVVYQWCLGRTKATYFQQWHIISSGENEAWRELSTILVRSENLLVFCFKKIIFVPK